MRQHGRYKMVTLLYCRQQFHVDMYFKKTTFKFQAAFKMIKTHTVCSSSPTTSCKLLLGHHSNLILQTQEQQQMLHPQMAEVLLDCGNKVGFFKIFWQRTAQLTMYDCSLPVSISNGMIFLSIKESIHHIPQPQMRADTQTFTEISFLLLPGLRLTGFESKPAGEDRKLAGLL